MNARAYLAELLGSFLFFTIGYASVAAFGVASAPTPNLLVVPFSFGFGLLAAIFAFGHVSGGHFNPAVTVAMVLDKRTTPADAVGYIIAQIIGAIAAGAVVLIAVSQDAVKAGITKPGTGVTDIGALILEVVFTAGFIAVILASTKRVPALAPLAIPLTLVAHPLRHGHAQWRLGQPGPLDRLGGGRRRPEPAVDLPRGADHRRDHRVGRVHRDRPRRGGRRRLTSRPALPASCTNRGEPAGVGRHARGCDRGPG